jgi:hypothetical protein
MQARGKIGEISCYFLGIVIGAGSPSPLPSMLLSP